MKSVRAKFFNRNLLFRVARVASALAIAFLLNQFAFDYLESVLYDTRVKLRPVPSQSSKISLVAVDKSTISHYNRAPDANDHLGLLNAIQEDKPRAIVYVMSPLEIKGDDAAIKSWINTAKTTNNFYAAINDIYSQGDKDRLLLPTPFEQVPIGSAPLSVDSNKFAEDSVTRRILIFQDGLATLQAQLAQMFNGIIHAKDYRGNFQFLNSTQAYIDYHPSGTFAPLSFFAVAERRFPPGTFTDKIVLVGRDTLEDANDYVRTPYSKNIVAMSKLEAQANVLDTLIRNNSPVRTPSWFNFLLTAIISLITVMVVWTVKPTKGLYVLGGTLATFALFCYLMFAVFNVWVAMAQPLLSIFMCYYFFIPYRLIKENRKSWEYLQKNRLLTQVEELKTNFMSMMSHDLKTPLARIQGMADIVLQDTNKLSSQQREAIVTINKSSEELSYFISSILNLTRVESQDIKLHLQTKDVNALLEEVIRKHDYMAQSKGIKIVTEFEPIFSFKMDVDLMRQVFGNLVENAIKYSPKNSKVLISTEEVDGKVQIQVADQGIGIPTEEVSNVFEKFYRSQNAKTSTVKGSGLGLYLAKYFVELHRGEIAVESIPQQGSTFSIQLPMEQ